MKNILIILTVLFISCKKESLVNIPNAFSPNNDGINDTFIIPFTNTELIVFDRNGNQVYYSNPYLNNWTAENINNGTYFYSLVSDNKTYNGYISIFR